MPWSVAFILIMFVPSLLGRHHSESRLMSHRYEKLSKYLLRQDALVMEALEALDKEVAVGESKMDRHQYDASPQRHHITQNHFLEKSDNVLFMEVQPFSDEFALSDFEEIPVGESPDPSPEAEVAGGCQCAGAASEGNAGNSDCKTTFKHTPWCYVQKGAGCKDKKTTDKMPTFMWSFEACASGDSSPENEDPTNAAAEKSSSSETSSASETATGDTCRCAGVKGEDGAGDSDCLSTWKSIPWCYVSKSAQCSDKQVSKKMKSHNWSHEACHKVVEEALQAEAAMAHNGCECAGVSGENNAGASDCKSTWKDIPWCYVDKASSCNDKMTSSKMTTHDWSHEACGHAVKEMENAQVQAESVLSHNGHDSCVCAGVTGENKAGGSDCSSTWEDKSWCYVEESAKCADAKTSKKKPGYHWSHDACTAASKSDAEEVNIAHNGHFLHKEQASCQCVDHKIHGMGGADCKSKYDGTGVTTAKSWCYVQKKSGCKDAQASSSHPLEFDWSYQACESSVAAGKNLDGYSDPEKFSSATGPQDAKDEGEVPPSSTEKKASPIPATAAQLKAPDSAPSDQTPPNGAMSSNPAEKEISEKDPSDTAVGSGIMCACSEGYSAGDGARDCNSKFEDKAWCYVDLNSPCKDKRQSSRFPDREWSHMACNQSPL